jgi:hypothetical protein
VCVQHAAALTAIATAAAAVAAAVAATKVVYDSSEYTGSSTRQLGSGCEDQYEKAAKAACYVGYSS